jgi:transcriptional regulator with XRE-family HTH domain
MEFKEATDQLSGISLADLAGRMGVSLNSVLRARMTGPNSRKPPEGWEEAVAKLARERARQLLDLANELAVHLYHIERAEAEEMLREIFVVMEDGEWHSRTALAQHLLNSGVLHRNVAYQSSFPITSAQRPPLGPQDEDRILLGAERCVQRLIRVSDERFDNVKDLNGTVRYRLTRQHN